MSRYLIDTNILSEPLKPQPNPAVMDKIHQHTSTIAIAAITWHEIRFGCDRLPPSRRRDLIAAYLHMVQETFPILPYDQAAGTWHASERARLRTQPPPFQDGQIAAIAAIHDLILVTNNTTDFANFQTLTLENWFAP
jgi:tRNA(fMet)-specific endonuclease VapC